MANRGISSSSSSSGVLGTGVGVPVITIAFMARLSLEKNPGLFLLAAKRLIESHRCAFCRFLVLGDGDLRGELEELSSRLEISGAVRFAGMLGGNELVAALHTVDIAVNPSLRAWSETFCIANIEVSDLISSPFYSSYLPFVALFSALPCLALPCV